MMYLFIHFTPGNRCTFECTSDEDVTRHGVVLYEFHKPKSPAGLSWSELYLKELVLKTLKRS